MNKAFLAAFVLTALTITGCAYPVKQQQTMAPGRSGASASTASEGRTAYRIRMRGGNMDIRDDAIQTATGFCQEQDKQFNFIRNVIRRRSTFGIETIHYDLYFTCEEKGAPAVAAPGVPQKPGEAVTVEKPAPAETPAVKEAAPAEEKAPAAEEASRPPVEEQAPPAPAEAPKEAAPPAPPQAKPAKAEAPAGPKSIDISDTAGTPESLGFQEPDPKKSKKLGVYGPGIVIEEVIIK